MAVRLATTMTTSLMGTPGVAEVRRGNAARGPRLSAGAGNGANLKRLAKREWRAVHPGQRLLRTRWGRGSLGGRAVVPHGGEAMNLQQPVRLRRGRLALAVAALVALSACGGGGGGSN